MEVENRTENFIVSFIYGILTLGQPVLMPVVLHQALCSVVSGTSKSLSMALLSRGLLPAPSAAFQVVLSIGGT